MDIKKIEREAAALVILARYGVEPDVQELLVSGDQGRGIRPGALRAAIDAALPAQEWQDISTAPPEPVQVELFWGKAHGWAPDGTEVSMVIAPYRDERRGLGYWDGQDWYHCGTGHLVFEFSDTHDDELPTHWRALPAAPVAIIADDRTK